MQGWAPLTRTITTAAAGLLCSLSRRQQAPLDRSHTHVRWLSRSVSNMAEEAKKLAAYAAVDNHVQVGFEQPRTPAASFIKSPFNETPVCYISYALAAE